MLPGHLIAEFWETFRRELRERHSLCTDETSKAIENYRLLIDRRRIGDLLCHRDPEDVAATIRGAAPPASFNGPNRSGLSGVDSHAVYVDAPFFWKREYAKEWEPVV